MVVQPEQVVEALGVAGGLLHPPLDLVLLALDEARLRLEMGQKSGSSFILAGKSE